MALDFYAGSGIDTTTITEHVLCACGFDGEVDVERDAGVGTWECPVCSTLYDAEPPDYDDDYDLADPSEFYDRLEDRP